MTPLEIKILLHYYTHADDYRKGDFSAPAVSDAIKYFAYELHPPLMKVKSIPDGQYYGLTDRGRAYCEALEALPLPEIRWVIP